MWGSPQLGHCSGWAPDGHHVMEGPTHGHVGELAALTHDQGDVFFPKIEEAERVENLTASFARLTYPGLFVFRSFPPEFGFFFSFFW